MMSSNISVELQPYEMILASAGSGKTYRLTTRMIGLMALGVEPQGFAALTFTKKAAGEFREQWLKKLAEGSLTESQAQQLSAELGAEVSQEQFLDWLEQALAQLPKMFLSTLDAYCFKVLSMMQHELGMVGQLQMADENETEDIAQEVLQQVLADDSKVASDFITIITVLLQGKEAFNINGQVQMIIRETLSLWEKVRGGAVAGEDIFFAGVEQLSASYEPYRLTEEAYHEQCQNLRLHQPEIARKGTQEVLDKLWLAFDAQDFKSAINGSLGAQFTELAAGKVKQVVYYKKEYPVTDEFIMSLEACLKHGAAQELQKQEQRLRALTVFLQRYYDIYHRSFIEQGKLSFDLVRHLLHDWLYQEDDHILAQKMEWLKFRLDASYQHWFLDEFQDTSGQDLEIMQPFLQESLTNEDSSVLVVGDKKQSVYGFRGGDYRLFNQLQESYPQFIQEHMAQSWRSTPPVLALVNRLFGDATLLKDYWGEEVLSQWQWQEHVSAKPLQTKAGKAQVLQLRPATTDSDDVKTLLQKSVIELVQQNPHLHWGILCRNNAQVAELVSALREAQLKVIENGRATPITQHPLGVLSIEILNWLEHPQDKRAWSYLLMSPLRSYWQSLLPKDSPIELSALHPASKKIWNRFHQQVKVHGFSQVWQELMVELETQLGSLSVSAINCQHIVEQQLRGLEEELKAGAYACVADKLMKFSQKVVRGEGLVEVMTVHASKGLTFDASIYAIEETKKFPDRKKIKYLELSHQTNHSDAGYWLGAPPSWLEAVVPELTTALQVWKDKEAYAEICTTYVALTRARKQSYLILPAMKDDSKVALAYWLAEAFAPSQEPATIYQNDTGELISLWELEQGNIGLEVDFEGEASQIFNSIDEQNKVVKLPKSQSLLRKKIPSQNHSTELEPNFIQRQRASQQAMKKGSDVHAAFEEVTWIDQNEPTYTGKSDMVVVLVKGCLENKAILEILSYDYGLKAGETKHYYQEQSFDVILEDDKKIGEESLWLSGIIDRLHLIKNHQGQVIRAEIIDFKTDKIVDAQALMDRHQTQLLDYAQAITVIYELPLSKIDCYLVSTYLNELIHKH